MPALLNQNRQKAANIIYRIISTIETIIKILVEAKCLVSSYFLLFSFAISLSFASPSASILTSGSTYLPVNLLETFSLIYRYLSDSSLSAALPSSLILFRVLDFFFKSFSLISSFLDFLALSVFLRFKPSSYFIMLLIIIFINSR